MKIVRIINDKEFEFELSNRELCLACEEYENNCYIDDIIIQMENYSIFFSSEDDKETFIQSVLYKYKKAMSWIDNPWEDILENAIHEVLVERGKCNEE